MRVELFGHCGEQGGVTSDGQWPPLAMSDDIKVVVAHGVQDAGADFRRLAKGGPEIAAASIDHVRRYIELLFHPATRKRTEAP